MVLWFKTRIDGLGDDITALVLPITRILEEWAIYLDHNEYHQGEYL